MSDPEKVIECIIEAQIISGPSNYEKNPDNESVKRHEKYNLPATSEVSQIKNVFKR